MLTPEQHEIRKKGITASEVASVLGLNPWRNAHDVMMIKKGLRENDVASNDAIIRGEVKEPMIVRWYETKTGRKVRYHGRHQRSVVKPDDPLVIATPDGIVGANGLLEAKAPGRYTIGHWGEPGTDEIPEYYIPQGIWQMAATNSKWVDFAVDLGDELGIYHLKWDGELYSYMREQVQVFWDECIIGDKLPEIDASQGCLEALNAVYPRVNRAVAAATDAEAELLAQYRFAHEQATEAARTKQLLGNRLRDLIGDRKGLECDEGKVLWSEVKGRAKTNWQAVAEELKAPEDIIQKHTTISDGYRALKPYWKKA